MPIRNSCCSATALAFVICKLGKKRRKRGTREGLRSAPITSLYIDSVCARNELTKQPTNRPSRTRYFSFAMVHILFPSFPSRSMWVGCPLWTTLPPPSLSSSSTTSFCVSVYYRRGFSCCCCCCCWKHLFLIRKEGNWSGGATTSTHSHTCNSRWPPFLPLSTPMLCFDKNGIVYKSFLPNPRSLTAGPRDDWELLSS